MKYLNFIWGKKKSQFSVLNGHDRTTWILLLLKVYDPITFPIISVKLVAQDMYYTMCNAMDKSGLILCV